MIHFLDSHVDQTTTHYTGCNIMLLLFLFLLKLSYNRGGHIRSIKLLLNVLVFVFTCDDDETNEAASHSWSNICKNDRLMLQPWIDEIVLYVCVEDKSVPSVPSDKVPSDNQISPALKVPASYRVTTNCSNKQVINNTSHSIEKYPEDNNI
jgi:hypothetical protein